MSRMALVAGMVQWHEQWQCLVVAAAAGGVGVGVGVG